MAEPVDPRLAAAMTAIDQVHLGDPTSIEVEGVPRAHELAHAEAVTAWVRILDPAATDLQVLAARASHLRRWERPRSDYPDGRAGYLRWRKAAAASHAEEVAALLAGAGYDGDEIDEVQRLIRKEGRGVVSGAQTHEDALCLAFLTVDVDAFLGRHGPERAASVLAKTAGKMSDRALVLAGQLRLSDPVQALVAQALPSP